MAKKKKKKNDLTGDLVDFPKSSHIYSAYFGEAQLSEVHTSRKPFVIQTYAKMENSRNKNCIS